jgi:predicted nucleic acid-binding protein
VIVIDASAVLEVLPRTSASAAVETFLFDPNQSLHAPQLPGVEVAQVPRRYATRGEIDRGRGLAALATQAAPADLAYLPLQRYPHTWPLPRYPHAWPLPRVRELRDNLTAYDAVYVALAEVLDAPLLTRDRRLATAAGHHARIELL